MLIPPLISLPKDHFMFATATPPGLRVKGTRCLTRWAKKLFKGRKETTLPMSALVACGWHREPLGWDHTNMKWYYPIWPELDDNLESPLDRSKIRLRLDWGVLNIANRIYCDA